MEQAYGWCPHCKKWVPAQLLMVDVDDDGSLIRMCVPCMEGTSDSNNYVYDPHHEETQCIYCDSYNTTEQKPNWRTFKCNDCGEIFKI